MNLRKLAVGIAVWGGIFVVGVLLFNFVLMPMLVHQRGAVIVPDLRNLSEVQAQKALDRVALNMRVDRSEYDPQVPEGYVVSQAPRASETIKQGRTVVVVLSLGTKTQTVPELRGMSLRQTRSVLQRGHLEVGRVAKVLTSGEAREEVLATNPPVGTLVPEGSAVDVVVAIGGQNQEFAMPDLTGQDLLFIRDKLRALGFRISGVRYEAHEGAFPNSIIGQTPKPGALIREGDSIELVAASAD